jgi:oligopeptide/dipeptide ABC transporter ATP-binding protein
VSAPLVATTPLLQVRDASVEFTVQKRRLRAVDDVSFSIDRGTTFGLIGESGSGKSTLARLIVGLVAGKGLILIDGQALPSSSTSARRARARRVQMVVQDPHAALDPRMTIAASVAEPLRAIGVKKEHREEQAMAMLERVGLSSTLGRRYPHQLSGGQKQRANIARALTTKPDLLICDESVSALDVALQAEILNLLGELRDDLDLTLLFISHDLGVIAHIASEVGVMYLGRLVERGDAEAVLGAPRHPYTEALISARPEPVPSSLRMQRRVVLSGEVPSPLDPPSGCHFRTRCLYAQDICARERPSLRQIAGNHLVACHFAEQLQLQGASEGDTVRTEGHPSQDARRRRVSLPL